MNIFDLEQGIMKAWDVVHDIDLLYENVLDTDMKTDDIANALLGLKTIYNMRFQKVMDLFEDHCKDYDALRTEKKVFQDGNKYEKLIER